MLFLREPSLGSAQRQFRQQEKLETGKLLLFSDFRKHVSDPHLPGLKISPLPSPLFTSSSLPFASSRMQAQWNNWNRFSTAAYRKTLCVGVCVGCSSCFVGRSRVVPANTFP